MKKFSMLDVDELFLAVERRNIWKLFEDSNSKYFLKEHLLTRSILSVIYDVHNLYHYTDNTTFFVQYFFNFIVLLYNLMMK